MVLWTHQGTTLQVRGASTLQVRGATTLQVLATTLQVLGGAIFQGQDLNQVQVAFFDPDEDSEPGGQATAEDSSMNLSLLSLLRVYPQVAFLLLLHS